MDFGGSSSALALISDAVHKCTGFPFRVKETESEEEKLYPDCCALITLHETFDNGR